MKHEFKTLIVIVCINMCIYMYICYRNYQLLFTRKVSRLYIVELMYVCSVHCMYYVFMVPLIVEMHLTHTVPWDVQGACITTKEYRRLFIVTTGPTVIGSIRIRSMVVERSWSKSALRQKLVPISNPAHSSASNFASIFWTSLNANQSQCIWLILKKKVKFALNVSM